MKKGLLLLFAFTCIFFMSCGSMESPGMADQDRNKENGHADAVSDYYPYTDALADGELPPPEEEIEADFRVPQASGRYIYVANSAEDYVVVIDSVNLDLEIVNVGKKPTSIATEGLRNSAMVINTGSLDISIIKTLPAAGSSVTNLPSIEGLNSIAISPAATGAVAFRDFDGAIDPEEGYLQSYQDVMVIMLSEGEEKSLQRTCGYMPREVEYDESGEKAFVVNKDGISLIDFSIVEGDNAPLPIINYHPSIPLELNDLEKDVDVSPAGDFAIVRLEESPESYSTSIWVIDLKDQSFREIVLPAVPYDLDLSPDGKFAVAVLPTLGQIAFIPLPVDDLNPFNLRDITSMFVGQAQISNSGMSVALFSNQSGEELVGVYDIEGSSFKVIQLHKTVKTVAFTPDDRIMVVIHEKEEGDPLDPDDYEDVADHSYGYSLVRISDGFVKQQLTKANPEPFLIHPEGSRIYLLQRDSEQDVREVEVIYTDSYIVNTVRLGSPPVSVGYVPDSNKIYISQEHSAGRITFIDEEENVQTVTGFELNDWIVE